jgi:hypothetical protein
MMNDHRSLLIVEDSDEDLEVTCWAFRQAGFNGPIRRCSRAEEALQQLCPNRSAILGVDSLCMPLSIDLYVEKLRSLLSYLFETVMLADAPC